MGQKLYDLTEHEMLLSKNQKIIRMSLKYIALKNPKWTNIQWYYQTNLNSKYERRKRLNNLPQVS